MPKNWMWDESEQLLRVIDFERAELQPAPRRDLSRLRYRILHHNPELNAAFHNGYGRTLTEDDVVACRAYGALDAVDALAWGCGIMTSAWSTKPTRCWTTCAWKAATACGAGGLRERHFLPPPLPP
jgi:hypothetical protein